MSVGDDIIVECNLMILELEYIIENTPLTPDVDIKKLDSVLATLKNAIAEFTKLLQIDA